MPDPKATSDDTEKNRPRSRRNFGETRPQRRHCGRASSVVFRQCSFARAVASAEGLEIARMRSRVAPATVVIQHPGVVRSPPIPVDTGVGLVRGLPLRGHFLPVRSVDAVDQIAVRPSVRRDAAGRAALSGKRVVGSGLPALLPQMELDLGFGKRVGFVAPLSATQTPGNSATRPATFRTLASDSGPSLRNGGGEFGSAETAIALISARASSRVPTFRRADCADASGTHAHSTC